MYHWYRVSHVLDDARLSSQHIPLIVFDPQQRSNFLGVGEPLCLDWRVWQEYGDQESDDDGQRPNSNVEDSPARKPCVRKADSIGDEATEYLGEGVADIKP